MLSIFCFSEMKENKCVKIIYLLAWEHAVFFLTLLNRRNELINYDKMSNKFK